VATAGEGGSQGAVATLGAVQESQAGEAPQRRQEPEVLAVPMDDDQELVYGWMGLSPALLLDPVPAIENVMVRVVRPDADPATVVEEARQQLAASGSRRRRRGRGGEGRLGSSETENGSSRVADGPLPADVPELQDRLDMTPILEITPAPFEPVSSPEPQDVVRAALPRRRSSAVTDEPPAAVMAAKGAEAASDDAGEPRRRRRRSSATG
jgi:ribonuclease E